MTWEPAPEALELLAGPYETAAYREACVEALRGLRDVTFGARADDGTLAAVALLQRGRLATSMPFGYGGVHATRALDEDERRTLTSAARSTAAAWALELSSGPDGPVVGRRIGTTLFVELDRLPSGRWSAQTAQKLRRIQRSGCTCEISGDVGEFLALYREASRAWRVRYPEELVRAAGSRGIARCYYVRDHGGSAISAAVALLGRSHWMYWFGAQNDAGRRLGGSYLAVATLLEDAQAANVAGVNLGASEGLPGVLRFKSSFGPVERPISALRIGGRLAALAARLSARGS